MLGGEEVGGRKPFGPQRMIGAHQAGKPVDANAPVPRLMGGPDGYFAGVGTVLFNMIVNPRTGRVYVSNTEARNEHRFEGHGDFLATLGKTSVRGHLSESRITVLGGSQRVPDWVV